MCIGYSCYALFWIKKLFLNWIHENSCFTSWAIMSLNVHASDASMLNDDVLNLFVKYCYEAKFNNDLCIKG